MASGVAIGVSLLLGLSLGPVALLIMLPAAILLGLMHRGVSPRLLMVMVGVSVIGILRGASAEADLPTSELTVSDHAIGVISRVPVAGGDFERSMLTVEQVRVDGEPWRDAAGEVIVFLPDRGEGVSLGDRVFVVWEMTSASELEPGYAGYVRGQGAIGSAWIFAYSVQDHGPAFFSRVADIRRAVSRELVSSFDGDAGALASGIVTGDDSTMSDATEDAFRRTGTAHVTAVSGQNISLLLGFLSLWMRPSRRSSRIVTHALMIAAVWLFALMVGLEAPAIRASVVATLTIAGAWSGRRPDPVTLLVLSLGVMAFISPVMTSTVGFWLSASASWALCSVVPVDPPEGVTAKVLRLAIGPLAASLATLPFLIWTFHEWSPVAPVANAALTPIMTVLFPVTYVFAALSLVPGPFADILAWIPGIGLDLSLSIVERMSGIAPQLHLDAPGARGAVMVGIPAVLILLAWSRDGMRWMRIATRPR